MDIKDLKISKDEIFIKVLTVGNRKFTISLFEQLIDKNPLEWITGPFKYLKNMRIDGELLGFVNRGNDRYVLWHKNGMLYKRKESELYGLHEGTHLEKDLVSYVQRKFYKDNLGKKVEQINDEGIYSVKQSTSPDYFMVECPLAKAPIPIRGNSITAVQSYYEQTSWGQSSMNDLINNGNIHVDTAEEEIRTIIEGFHTLAESINKIKVEIANLEQFFIGG